MILESVIYINQNKKAVLIEIKSFVTTKNRLLCPLAWTSHVVVVVALLFYVHGKHLRSCRDGQLT